LRKFEASRGIDPFSYGYNSATPDNRHATADEHRAARRRREQERNFLLGIGPRAWLHTNRKAIYNTAYWVRGATDANLPFTVAPNKAC
jgi:alpha-L-fucosidase